MSRPGSGPSHGTATDRVPHSLFLLRPQVRKALYMCGPSTNVAQLPAACEAEGLNVLDCLRGGHLRDKSTFRIPPLSASDVEVLDGLVGEEEDGVAMAVCSACIGRPVT